MTNEIILLISTIFRKKILVQIFKPTMELTLGVFFLWDVVSSLANLGNVIWGSHRWFSWSCNGFGLVLPFFIFVPFGSINVIWGAPCWTGLEKGVSIIKNVFTS